MDRLQNLVLIAGPNGAGKTRLISRIKFAIDHKLTNAEFEQTHNEITSYQRRLLSEDAKASLRTNLDNRIKKIQWSDLIETDQPIINKIKYVDFVPKNLSLADCNQFSKASLIQEATNVGLVGISHLANGTFAKIQSLQNSYWDVTHQNSEVPSEVKQEIVHQYRSLQHLVKAFMKTDLGRDHNGDATIFGLPLGKAQLSDGQTILLQYCIAIYAQASKLNDLVIFLDEPENHLHPEVLLFTLDRIREVTPNTQIWISTHSLPLLAHFDPSTIWFMSNGGLQYAGRGPKQVLTGLLGNEEEIAKLSTFLNLPAQHASVQFALECLMSPKVSDETNDPQSKQILEFLKISKAKEMPLRVLDFGAGLGRLVMALKSELGNDFIDTIDYFAYDSFEPNKDACISAINFAYEESTDRYFNSQTEALTKLDAESVDVIILCNVLHEVDPKDWLNLFSSENLIMKLLKPNGKILIVEDHLMPTGENAHSKGFMVLDTLELKCLFKIKEYDKAEYEVLDFKNQGRLKAHALSKNLLKRISPDSRKEAVKALMARSKYEISTIRQLETSYKNGLKHAFWVQQLANASLAIDEL